LRFKLGWVTDRERGYRYQPTHPATGKPWPDIPGELLDLWNDVSGYDKPPEACLVNFYSDDAKMGLHQDKDERDLSAPVVSISLGNTCLFRVGGLARTDKTSSFKLSSGDVVILGGEGRLCFHGVDRIYPATSTLLKNGGRINLTLRRDDGLKLSQRNLFGQVILVLAQDEVGAGSRRQDVFAQVLQVDVLSTGFRRWRRRFLRQLIE
jgi:alkylated DNA repair protein (DNA oxidative demethylase)